MKKPVVILFAFSIILSASKCNDKKEEPQSERPIVIEAISMENRPAEKVAPGLQKIYNTTWRLARYNGVSIDHDIYGDEAFILQFNNNIQYSFSLDKNSCFGSVKADDRGAIAFELPACTEMCCDSEFAMQVMNELHAVNKYRLPELRMLFLLGDSSKFEFEMTEE